MAELFLVVSVDLSDFGSYWQHLNTKENGEGGFQIRKETNGIERIRTLFLKNNAFSHNINEMLIKSTIQNYLNQVTKGGKLAVKKEVRAMKEGLKSRIMPSKDKD